MPALLGWLPFTVPTNRQETENACHWSNAVLVYSGAAPGSTVLPQMPGTILREQLTSLPGKAALLFHLPPHHPSLPYPDCQGRKIPSRQGGSLTTVEQCPLVAAGYMLPLSIPNYCPVPVPKARRKNLAVSQQLLFK